MQLPNMTLQPGTYVIKLADSDSNRHIVQFFDKDEKHLITTVLAIPNDQHIGSIVIALSMILFDDATTEPLLNRFKNVST